MTTYPIDTRTCCYLIPALALLLATGCDALKDENGPCAENEGMYWPNQVSGKTGGLVRCIRTSDVVWYDEDLNVVYEGYIDDFHYACQDLEDPDTTWAACTRFCEEEAEYYGAEFHDCGQWTLEFVVDEPGVAPNCDMGATCPLVDPEHPENSVFCGADPNAPMNTDDDWDNDGFTDFDGPAYCARAATYGSAGSIETAAQTCPTTSCGFAQFVQPGQSPDQACKSLCNALLNIQGHDENNCDTFGVRTECTSSQASAGDPYVWGTGLDQIYAPLECDHCCTEFGWAACENIAAGAPLSQMAASSTSLFAVATLTAGAGVSHGVLRLDLDYSTSSCASTSGVCPLYLEAIHATLDGLMDIVVHDLNGSLATYRILELDVTSDPTVAAHRTATGEIQIAPRGLFLRGAVEVVLPDGSGMSSAILTANSATIHGTLDAQGYVTIAGDFEIPGVGSLSLSGPVIR